MDHRLAREGEGQFAGHAPGRGPRAPAGQNIDLEHYDLDPKGDYHYKVRLEKDGQWHLVLDEPGFWSKVGHFFKNPLNVIGLAASVFTLGGSLFATGALGVISSATKLAAAGASFVQRARSGDWLGAITGGLGVASGVAGWLGKGGQLARSLDETQRAVQQGDRIHRAAQSHDWTGLGALALGEASTMADALNPGSTLAEELGRDAEEARNVDRARKGDPRAAISAVDWALDRWVS